MEEFARNITMQFSIAVEAIAAIVIAVGLVKFLVGYIPDAFKKKAFLRNAYLRVQFGSTLTVALELLLAADILRTAVSPNWEDIGKLAAIAAIRTALNYFLDRELREMETRMKDGDHEI